MNKVDIYITNAQQKVTVIVASVGTPGPIGPEGPEGPPGEAFQILGAFGEVRVPADLPPDGLIPADWDGPGRPINDLQMQSGESLFFQKDGDPLTGHLYAYFPSEQFWQDLGFVQGPAGPQGEQGEPGTPGAQGEQGEQGAQGEQGIQGEPGVGTIDDKLVLSDVNGDLTIDLNVYSFFKLTLTGLTTLLLDGMPGTGKTKNFTMKVTGLQAFNLPSYFTIAGDDYDGTLWNFFAIEVENGVGGQEEVTCFITNL